jgi:DNA-directed RNA polymerase subunit RPC12/RpoP
MIYTCYRCGKEYTREQTVPSGKIKGLSLEASKLIRVCSFCKCRVFIIK